MEDNTPERLDKSLTRLEMAHQLSETAELILADVNKLVAYLASVDANGDGIVDEAVNITLKDAGKIRKHATAIRGMESQKRLRTPTHTKATKNANGDS